MTEEVVQLDGDIFEQRVSVDRQKLEAMITGKFLEGENLPNAELFFAQVTQNTGAAVLWPAQLKIGAKTKRDPFVKVQGTRHQIEEAKNIIVSSLQTKKVRVTLKIDVHHSFHSNIIGKGGKGIQQIMRSTKCHIHFPDSNKFSEKSTKSDQVSISGHPSQVDSARSFLRCMSPIVISMELPWLTSCSPPILPYPDVMWFQRLTASLYVCFVKGGANDETQLFENIGIVLSLFSIPPEFPLVLRTSIPLREELIVSFRNSESGKLVAELAEKLKVELNISGKAVFLSGSFHAVLATRKYLIGFLPASLSFDVPLESLNRSHLNTIQNSFEVEISTKNKTNQSGYVSVLLQSFEKNVIDMLRARDLILNESNQNVHNQEFVQDKGSLIGNESVLPTAVPPSLLSYPYMPMSEPPKSPDPEDSPLAASILQGAKNFEKSTDRWSKKSNHADREEMLTKAAQALFNDTPRSGDRYPTDHFAGYGFSCSLPADLLKGMIEVQNEPEQGRLIVGRDAKTPPSRGLCSVKEEDEMSNFTGSFSSTSAHSLQRVFEKSKSRQAAFSASTSIFDAAPVVGDFTWDVRVFTDPAHVLAQLGCSEYLAQMRDQEIDMHAFILLDEQNLKDIGVSTIGARKKIHHAILKLRESARRHGFAI